MLLAPEEQSKGLIEYAILLSFVALVVIFVVRALDTRVSDNYSTINNSIP